MSNKHPARGGGYLSRVARGPKFKIPLSRSFVPIENTRAKYHRRRPNGIGALGF